MFHLLPRQLARWESLSVLISLLRWNANVRSAEIMLVVVKIVFGQRLLPSPSIRATISKMGN